MRNRRNHSRWCSRHDMHASGRHRPALRLYHRGKYCDQPCQKNGTEHGNHLETRLRGLTVRRMRHFRHWFQALGEMLAWPHPLFFVSVASKRVRDRVSCLFATLTGWSISVASKGVTGAAFPSKLGASLNGNLWGVYPRGICKDVKGKGLREGAFVRM